MPAFFQNITSLTPPSTPFYYNSTNRGEQMMSFETDFSTRSVQLTSFKTTIYCSRYKSICFETIIYYRRHQSIEINQIPTNGGLNLKLRCVDSTIGRFSCDFSYQICTIGGVWNRFYFKYLPSDRSNHGSSMLIL